MTIDVITQDGKPWTIKKENLSTALQRGASISNAGEKVKVTTPDGKIWDIKTSNLSTALQRGASYVSPTEQANQQESNFGENNKGLVQSMANRVATGLLPETTLDRAKEFGQGIARGIGGTADFINKNIVSPTINAAGNDIKRTGEFFNDAGINGLGNTVTNFGNKAKEYAGEYDTSNAAETLPKSEFLQTTKKADEISDVYKAAGDVASSILPFSAAAKGVKLLTQAGGIVTKVPWINKMNALLETPITAKNTAIFAGAGAGGELAKSNDPNTSEIENIVREVAGSMFTAVTVASGLNRLGAMTAKVIFDPKKYIFSPLKTYKDAKFIKNYGGEVNENVVASAEKLGLPLTPELISNNSKASFLANNRLKSEFVDASYSELNKNLNEKIIQSLEDNIFENIGTKIEGSSAESAASVASTEAKKTISANKEKWYKESTALYDSAKDIAPAGNLKAPETSKTISNIIEELSFGDKSSGNAKQQVINKLEQLQANIQGGIDVRNLLGWKSDLFTLGAEQQSYKALYNNVARVIDNDINSFVSSGHGAKEFVDAWKQATDFNRDTVQNIIKTDAVRSILQKEKPIEAIQYMNNKRSVEEVSKMIDNPELMTSLKRTAFEKQIYDKNIITPDGSINSKQLERFLEKQKDFVVSLIDTKNYNSLKNDFLPYLKQRTAGIKNTSGTSYITRDNNLQIASENLIPYSAWGALIGLVGSQSLKGAVAGGAAGAIPGVKAKLEIKAIKQLSKMASDQKLMQSIIEAGRKPKVNNSLLNNPALKYNALMGGDKLINNHIEENKAKPKGQALNKLLDSDASQNIAKMLRASPFD